MRPIIKKKKWKNGKWRMDMEHLKHVQYAYICLYAYLFIYIASRYIGNNLYMYTLYLCLYTIGILL